MATAVTDILASSGGAQSPSRSVKGRTELISLTESVKFDCVISRTHGFSSDVTSSTVEDGSTINDHIIHAPRTLTIEGMVSDYPIDQSAQQSAYESARPRSEAAASILERLWQEKTLLRVVTRLRVYDDMVIERLDWTESNEEGEALSFSMSLREIHKVAVVTTTIEKLAAPAKDLAAGKVQRGRQKKKAVAEGAITSIRSASERAGIALKSVTGAIAGGTP